MPESAMRTFNVMKSMDRPPIRVEARNFKDFLEKAMCRSRTETVRALKSGNSFFIEGKQNPDYHDKKHNLSRITVALEALRNMRDTEGVGSCSLHVFDEDNNQVHFGSLPNADERIKFAEKLNDAIFDVGAILLIAGAKSSR